MLLSIRRRGLPVACLLSPRNVLVRMNSGRTPVDDECADIFLAYGDYDAMIL